MVGVLGVGGYDSSSSLESVGRGLLGYGGLLDSEEGSLRLSGMFPDIVCDKIHSFVECRVVQSLVLNMRLLVNF